jgi:hypothetical protein
MITVTRERLVVGIPLAVLMLFGWWITAQEPFSAVGTVAIIVAGLCLIAVATVWRRRTVPAVAAPDDDPVERKGIVVWAALIGALVVWELTTLFSHPREAHPTISSIIDPVQSQHLARWLLFGAWLVLGWALAT